MSDRVLIIDFGSQYTQLIARRVREFGVYCEIIPPVKDLNARIESFAPAALILSGGPSSVNDEDAPTIDASWLDGRLPVLGICYGLQLMTHLLGGKVVPSASREYGSASLDKCESSAPGALVLAELGHCFDVWMSHGDKVEDLAPGFEVLAKNSSTPIAAIAHRENPLLGLQFHPEVVHTPEGASMLRAFVFGMAKLKPTWSMGSFLEQQIEKIRAQVGPDEQVICGLSGGVDSSVVAALLARAIGDRLHCVFVDNGLLRSGERDLVERVFKAEMGLPLHVEDARDDFLKPLEGVSDPEVKRKTIGRVFIEVFERVAKSIPNVVYLAQGTLYPDVIESVSHKGPSVTIKSHHNVGGLPERLNFSLIEPLRELFKDEARALGEELGLPKSITQRHPFPGPGLAIRVAGAISAERLNTVREADRIVCEEIEAAGIYHSMWQALCVLLPVKSVGVMGDSRTYEDCLSLRLVESVDGMTADWAKVPYAVLGRISNRVINEVSGINRVLYDISSKPPSTIEWE